MPSSWIKCVLMQVFAARLARDRPCSCTPAASAQLLDTPRPEYVSFPAFISIWRPRPFLHLPSQRQTRSRPWAKTLPYPRSSNTNNNSRGNLELSLPPTMARASAMLPGSRKQRMWPRLLQWERWSRCRRRRCCRTVLERRRSRPLEPSHLRREPMACLAVWECLRWASAVLHPFQHPRRSPWVLAQLVANFRVNSIQATARLQRWRRIQCLLEHYRRTH